MDRLQIVEGVMPRPWGANHGRLSATRQCCGRIGDRCFRGAECQVTMMRAGRQRRRGWTVIDLWLLITAVCFGKGKAILADWYRTQHAPPACAHVSTALFKHSDPVVLSF